MNMVYHEAGMGLPSSPPVFADVCEMVRQPISLKEKPSGWIVRTLESPDGLLLYWFQPSQAPWMLSTMRVPEAVFLGPDWFGYYPGSNTHVGFALWPRHLAASKAEAVDSAKIVTLAVHQLREFAMESFGGPPRLLFTDAVMRREIGACLIDPERAWLFALLQQWRQGIDVQRVRDVRVIDAAMAAWKQRWSDPEQTGIIDQGG